MDLLPTSILCRKCESIFSVSRSLDNQPILALKAADTTFLHSEGIASLSTSITTDCHLCVLIWETRTSHFNLSFGARERETCFNAVLPFKFEKPVYYNWTEGENVFLLFRDLVVTGYSEVGAKSCGRQESKDHFINSIVLNMVLSPYKGSENQST